MSKSISIVDQVHLGNFVKIYFLDRYTGRCEKCAWLIFAYSRVHLAHHRHNKNADHRTPVIAAILHQKRSDVHSEDSSLKNSELFYSEVYSLPSKCRPGQTASLLTAHGSANTQFGQTISLKSKHSIRSAHCMRR